MADKVTEKSGQTGEKVELVYYAKIEAPMCVTYIHTNHKLGVLVGFNKEIAMETAKDVAMQAAAMAPLRSTPGRLRSGCRRKGARNRPPSKPVWTVSPRPCSTRLPRAR